MTAQHAVAVIDDSLDMCNASADHRGDEMLIPTDSVLPGQAGKHYSGTASQLTLSSCPVDSNVMDVILEIIAFVATAADECHAGVCPFDC